MNDAGSKSKHLAHVLTPISVNWPFSESANDEPSSMLHGACSGLLAPPIAQNSVSDGLKFSKQTSLLITSRVL